MSVYKHIRKWPKWTAYLFLIFAVLMFIFSIICAGSLWVLGFGGLCGISILFYGNILLHSKNEQAPQQIKSPLVSYYPKTDPVDFLRSKGIELRKTSVISYMHGAMRQPDLTYLLEQYANLRISEEMKPVSLSTLFSQGEQEKNGQIKDGEMSPDISHADDYEDDMMNYAAK